jgi:LysM repeat protein
MKNLIAFFIFLLPLFAQAQRSHTVAAKESLYSIARMYNIHPRELATFNNISINDGLNIGQVIKIPGKTSMEPLNDNPATTAPVKTIEQPRATEKTAVTKTGAPVYHTVEAREGLYSISKKYNVSIAQIKQWNSLDSDNISIGMDLVVGYNGTAKQEPEKTAPPKPQAAVEKPRPVEKQEPVVVQETKTPAPVAQKPTPAPAKESTQTPIAADYRGGYFKPFYDKQVAGNRTEEESGNAGIFKSTSGWEDGKYYCLHNGAPAGSYIKVTNPSNQKFIYAKVLDLIPDLKQNNSLIIRVSNAAAAVLGVEGNEFNCKLEY